MFGTPTTSLAGGDGRDMTRDIDRNIARALRMPDGKSLLVAGHEGTGVGMWVKALSGRTEPPESPCAFSARISAIE